MTMRRTFSPRAFARKSARAFTLIELMVALSAGLFLSIFVFMLTRDVSRFFQAESRLADATMGAVIGFERLKADIARAGFLASPNLRRDPGRCPRAPAPLVGGGWASVPALADMGLLYIARGGGGASLTTGGAFLTANGLTPDRLRLYGNYQTADQFPARSVSPQAASVPITLEPRSGAMIRLGYVPGAANALEVVQAAFPVGRALRLVNAEGEEQYSVIQTVAINAGTLAPVVTVNSSALSLVYQSAQGTCGIRGHGGEVLVNVVNIIDYRLDDLLRSSAAFQDLATVGGEDTARTDLIREEIDPATGVAFVGSGQIVAEYAVDFRLGLTAVTSAATLALTRYAEGDAAMDSFATPIAAPQPNQGPHYIRAVRPRLSVRARAADRGGNITPTPGLYRVALGTGGQFARVRSLTATIATRNARGALWQ